MKTYRATKTGKAEFVRDVLDPLLVQADTGWAGAAYEYDDKTHEEHVYLLTPDGYRAKSID